MVLLSTPIKTVLWSGRAGHVQLLRWRRGDGFGMHDHGRHSCRFQILYGIALNTDKDGIVNFMTRGHECHMGIGQQHSIMALNNTLSIHAYARGGAEHEMSDMFHQTLYLYYPFTAISRSDLK